MKRNLSAQDHALGVRIGLIFIDSVHDETGYFGGQRIQFDASGLDPREIQEIVDHALQPITILTRGVEQLGLLVGERSRHLLGAKMNRHAQRGKRCAKFVRDGGD